LIILILSFLELSDIRTFAKTSASLYRNIYNPHAMIFTTVSQRIVGFEPRSKPFYQRKHLLKHLNSISDFTNKTDIHRSYNWKLIIKSTKGRVLLVYKTTIVMCNASIQGRFDDLMELDTLERFATIRHWLARYMGLQVHQIDIKELLNDIRIQIPKTLEGGFPSKYMINGCMWVPLSYFGMKAKIKYESGIAFIEFVYW
jgi:hypothetical protein